MHHRLPPLNTLRLFEAAGRLLSFKAAAEELGVTPSAVSHGVQTLEDWLGAPLFHRRRRGITLTRAGAEYLPAVADALSLFATAADLVPRSYPGNALHISVAPTFASRLLLPRLHLFQARWPDISVSIDTTHRTVEFPRDGVDLAIRHGNGEWPGVHAECLFAETLIPVCAPALIERIGKTDRFCDAPLIHLTMLREDWQAWATACGRGTIDCERGLKVDTIQMAIEAAVQGMGIAIGRRPLVDPELNAGTLVTFCGDEVQSKSGYWLVTSEDALRRPEVKAFRKWLKEELKPLGKRRHCESRIPLDPAQPS